MTDELEINDSSNVEETQDSTLETETTEVDDAEARIQKAEEIARNQKIRAEKAEQELKALKKTPPKVEETITPKSDGLTAKDVIALRDVHEEDVDYLLDEAKLRNKSVAELKKDPYMKIILQTRAEERKTAEATATSSNRQSSSKSKGEDLLKRAVENKLSPDEMREAAKAMIASMK